MKEGGRLVKEIKKRERRGKILGEKDRKSENDDEKEYEE